MVNSNTSLLEQIAKLEQRLSSLEQKKIIAGSDLRITEVNETLLLIERVPYNHESESLAERLQQAEETLREHLRADWIAGEGLTVNNNGMQKIIEIDPALLNQTQPGPATGSGLDDFPFRVRLYEEQPETGDTRNFLLCAGGYDLPEALVYAGTAEPVRIGKHIFQTDQDCCIFLRVVLAPPPSDTTPGTLNITVEQDHSFPAPTVAEYIVPIAKIIFHATGFVIQQMQFGNIYLAGRVI